MRQRPGNGTTGNANKIGTGNATGSASNCTVSQCTLGFGVGNGGDTTGSVHLALTNCRAKPSRVSYVKAFRLNDAALDRLPPTMTSGLIDDDDDQDAARKAELNGLSWRKFIPGLKIQKKYANGIEVMEPALDDEGKPDPDHGAEVDLEIKAFGDFNGDGIEDVLLWTTDQAVRGTLYWFQPVALTRLTPGGPLKQIEIENAEIERAMTRASQARTTRAAKKTASTR
jgi:hypothetical protein